MKLKAKKRQGGAVLIGTAPATDELLYAEAERIRCGCGDALLTFTYAQKGKGWRFEYFMGTARPLRRVLKAPLSAEHFEAMLASFLELGREVDAQGLSLQRVCFEGRFLFFDPARYALRFAYLPVRSRRSPSRPSGPLEALALVAQQAKLTTPSVRALAQRALDHAKRNAVFSWPEYEAFLGEAGISVPQRADAFAHAQPSEPATRLPDHRQRYGYDFTKTQLPLRPTPLP